MIADPATLLTWLRDNAITVVHASPRTLRLLGGAAGVLPALRHAVLCGDTVYDSDLTQLRGMAPNARCVRRYGAAEVPGGYDPGQLVLRGDAGGPVAVGEVGEVLVRAPYLPYGYLGDPVATAERFVPDPARPGRRLLRTGGLGRRLPGDDVELLGPRHHVLRVRHRLVDVSRVERALLADPEVRDATVIARYGPADTAELVAYVVPGDPAPPAADLRARVAREVPDHAVLSQVVLLDALPLTHNGRVDRSALPAPAPAPPIAFDPRTPLEEQLVALFREVLDVDRVGVHDSFFDLGGHSLSAIQLASRVKSTLMADLPLREFFEATTVAQLALRVLHAQAGLMSDDEIDELLGELESGDACD